MCGVLPVPVSVLTDSFCFWGNIYLMSTFVHRLRSEVFIQLGDSLIDFSRLFSEDVERCLACKQELLHSGRREEGVCFH